MNDFADRQLDLKKVRHPAEDLRERMLEQRREADDFWSDIKDEALDDLQFSRGEDADQWEAREWLNRKAKQRPAYTFNRTQPFIDSLLGAAQQASFAININATTHQSAPFSSEQDREYNQAQAYEAIIRSIEAECDADLARMYALEMAMTASFGFYSVLPRYEDEASFHQTIGINRIANPMNVVLDPRAVLEGPEKATYGFLFDMVPRKRLEEQEGRRLPAPHDVKGTALEGWYLKDHIRVAKYFTVMKRKAQLLLLSDGRVYEREDLEKHAGSLLTGNVSIIEQRDTHISQTYWGKVIGGQIEGGLKEFPSKYIPIVPVFGRLKVIDGEPILRSAIRNAKTPQQVYNMMESALAEVVEKAPKTQWLIDWDAVPEKFREAYGRANFDDLVALFYQGSKGNPPAREQPIQAHPGLVQGTQRAWENLKGSMGMFQDAFENEGVDASGRALRERRGDSETVSFPYLRNLESAMTYEGRLLVDMIPRVYTYEQTLRLSFNDGHEDFLRVNKMVWNPTAGKYEFANELTHQRFQISVDMGPAQRTMREEASETLRGVLEIVSQVEPRLVPPVLRLFAENQNWAGAQDFADMVGTIVDPAFTEGQGGQAQEITPAMVQQQVAQAVQEALQQAGVELEQFKAETDRMEALADRIKAMAAQVAAQADMVEARRGPQ